MLLERLIHRAEARAGADDSHVARNRDRPHRRHVDDQPRVTERPAKQ